jgi:uncharacterized protein (DUF433 family)
VSLQLTADPVPLVCDADGVIRVGSTRVTLDTVIAAYREGMTPEGIVEQYQSLLLPELYLVIGYALHHPEEIATYLRDRQVLGESVRQENEARFSPVGVRDRLLSRRQPG